MVHQLETSNYGKLLPGAGGTGWKWGFQKGRPSGKSCSHGGGGGTQWYVGSRKEMTLISLSSKTPVPCWWLPAKAETSCMGVQPPQGQGKGKEGIWEANAEVLV